jgi:hypothetical protein
MSDPCDKINLPTKEMRNTMGLDQYLTAKTYVSRHDYEKDGLEPNPLFDAIVSSLDCEKYLDPEGHSGISVDVPVGYWRKANQIHAWFVGNVQSGDDNCLEHLVRRNQLEVLKTTCQLILAKKDSELAKELLPISEGFFFGGGAYDEYYFHDIERTISIIDNCLSTPNNYEFYYQSSW